MSKDENSNTLHAEVPRLGAQKSAALPTFGQVPKKRLPSRKLASRQQYVRDERCLSRTGVDANGR